MNKIKILSASLVWIFFVFLFAFSNPTATFAASPYYKEVCASGCAFPNVQSAIDSIVDSGPDKVYTVFIDSGVLESDVSITTNSKSYINFVGRGMGTSILRASTVWFQNVASGATSGDFFDLTGSSNITSGACPSTHGPKILEGSSSTSVVLLAFGWKETRY